MIIRVDILVRGRLRTVEFERADDSQQRLRRESFIWFATLERPGERPHWSRWSLTSELLAALSGTVDERAAFRGIVRAYRARLDEVLARENPHELIKTADQDLVVLPRDADDLERTAREIEELLVALMEAPPDAASLVSRSSEVLEWPAREPLLRGDAAYPALEEFFRAHGTYLERGGTDASARARVITLGLLALKACRTPEVAAVPAPTTAAREATNPAAQTTTDFPPYEDAEQPWFVEIPTFPETSNAGRAEGAEVLILTATQVELKATLRVMTPELRVRDGQHTYYVGSIGPHRVVAFMCAPGSMSRDAATLSVAAGIRRWSPQAVVVVGIAFGVDRAKQRIADVLVASQIISYEQQRVGSNGFVPRGTVADAGPILLDRFKNALSWSFRCPDSSTSRMRFGAMLSGEKLIDDRPFLDELLKAYPQAIGGEMEGAGVCAAASRAEAKVEWIVVKGICDWADGTKNDIYQPLAAAAAVSLMEFVLKDALAMLPAPVASPISALPESSIGHLSQSVARTPRDVPRQEEPLDEESVRVIRLPEIHWPPVLRDIDKTILADVFECWRDTGQWPLRKKLRVAFKKRGTDLDEELRRLPSGLYSIDREGFSPDDMVVLRLPGIALTPEGRSVLPLFLAMLQRGIDRFMADPYGHATVTDQDLHEVATGVDAVRLGRWGRVIADELRATRFEKGGWSWEPYLTHVKFDGVTDFWDYVRRREAHFRDFKLDVPGDDLLRIAYEEWHATGSWPELARFVIQHRTHGSVQDWLVEQQRDLSDFQYMGQPGERLILRVHAVNRVAPQAPELPLFIRILKLVRESYMEDTEVRLTDEDVATGLGVPVDDVRRVGEWFNDDYDAGVSRSGRSEPWSVRGNESLLQWDGLDDINDYLARRDARRKAEGWGT